MGYSITVTRSKIGRAGWLFFKHGDVVVNTPCWWDDKKIDAGTYLGAATRMAEKLGGRTADENGDFKREGIFLRWRIRDSGGTLVSPRARGEYKRQREKTTLYQDLPANNGTTTADEVFIHKGTGPGDSDACIVAVEDEVLKIWNCIKDEGDYDNYVVTVRIVPVVLESWTRQ